MFKMVQLVAIVILCFMLSYIFAGFIHAIIDQHSLPFATYYRSWMPGNYSANGCDLININDNFYECEIYVQGEAFIYVRRDKYTGIIF